MAERSLRGMSIGAKSLESDDNVDFAARVEVAYVCPKGHRTILPFAEGAEPPAEWECRCGAVAHQEDADATEADEITKPTRTHWDMLLERRTEQELSELLEKRLQMHRDGWFPDYE
ncbi:RNA polymerase-binding protein RbpA [Bifidobacterium choloepi]|uniref:RNA polymerase-binding protein RbpA n=1 Tax=Bifidobacterium choloepi TaxID=2614131 RepID=A0A6I5MXZ0_9BIFI|nr:RNA polymerase-binding protein RbpA [Bifidobacterium choloepi]NEG69127.1 RNA polymerase-binding protein RbpA [Bifidobacterium choloepi]